MDEEQACEILGLSCDCLDLIGAFVELVACERDVIASVKEHWKAQVIRQPSDILHLIIPAYVRINNEATKQKKLDVPWPICLRLNHMKGEGCRKSDCRAAFHACMLCGEEDHGLHMITESGDYKCSRMAAIKSQMKILESRGISCKDGEDLCQAVQFAHDSGVLRFAKNSRGVWQTQWNRQHRLTKRIQELRIDAPAHQSPEPSSPHQGLPPPHQGLGQGYAASSHSQGFPPPHHGLPPSHQGYAHDFSSSIQGYSSPQSASARDLTSPTFVSAFNGISVSLGGLPSLPPQAIAATTGPSGLNLSEYHYVNRAAVDRDLICPLCNSPFVDPVQLLCQHVFCRSCLGQHPTCPICGVPAATTQLSGQLSRNLGRLQVKCGNIGSGCDWIGERSNVGAHMEKSCDKYVCKNTPCPFRGLRDQIMDHQSECIHGLMSCPMGCGALLSHMQLLGHNCASQIQEQPAVSSSPQLSDLNRLCLRPDNSEILCVDGTRFILHMDVLRRDRGSVLHELVSPGVNSTLTRDATGAIVLDGDAKAARYIFNFLRLGVAPASLPDYEIQLVKAQALQWRLESVLSSLSQNQS